MAAEIESLQRSESDILLPVEPRRKNMSKICFFFSFFFFSVGGLLGTASLFTEPVGTKSPIGQFESEAGE